jgi:hypothetical protein
LQRDELRANLLLQSDIVGAARIFKLLRQPGEMILILLD